MRGIVVLVALLVTGCFQKDASMQPTPADRTPSIGQVTTQLRTNWERCLVEAYGSTRRQTNDRNAAAESAFQSCATEESSLLLLQARINMPPEVHAGLRYRTKQQLLAIQ